MPILRVLALAGCALATGCAPAPPATSVAGGDPDAGRALIRHYGCYSCHTVPGVRGADALVGPPLTQFGRRSIIAGHLPNTPGNLMHWIQHPRRVSPDTAMPELDVSEGDARHIAAYLYTLR